MPDSEFAPPPPDAPLPPPPPPLPPRAPERPKVPVNRTKTFLLAVIVLAMAVASTALIYLLVKHKGKQAESVVSGDMQKLTEEYAELKKKFDELEADRNNVLSQTKTLLQEKAQWQDAESQLENLKKTNKVFMQQKEKLLEENRRLKEEVSTILQNFDGLKQSFQDLMTKQEEAEKENAQLRDLLTKQVQATPEYQLIDREAKRLREENELLGQTITSMEAKLKLALDRIKKDQERELSMLRQVRGQKEILDEIRAQNEALTKANQELNGLITQAPGRIKDMAAQNQALLKETAEMHYNMGVFFTDNKQFPQAEREYVRALEFDPNNQKVHYNLGYLYAEELEKHDKAMFHMEKYLQIAPNSKESESIRSYIATRQAWNGGPNTGKKR
jgi:tetratricopeptide (TPR) repeat protein